MLLLDRLVVATLPAIPKSLIRVVASRYIAGEKLEDAVRVVKELNARGMKATIDVLGEFVSDPAQAAHDIEAYLKLFDAIVEHKLETGVSVKLTAVGLSIDPQFARKNLKILLEAALAHNVFVRIDMEDSPYTSETLAIYEEYRSQYKLGIVVQAYLKRTSDDVKRLMDQGQTNFRLCKGIYVEHESIAYKDRRAIQENYLRLLDQMLSGGALVGIATHDRYLVEESEKMLKGKGTLRKNYEYQMLLGVLPDLRDEIVSRGHRMRIYVPYGDAWYGYSTRRLKENPAIAGYVFKGMLGIK